MIEEPEHKYHGLWAVFYTRSGLSGLTEDLPLVDILIGPDEPVQVESEPEMPGWPNWRFTHSPQIAGYGMVAETLEHMESYGRKAF